MFSFISRFLTKRKVAGDNARLKKHFVAWNKVEKIALLIDEDTVNKNEIDKFIDSTKKYAEVFYTELKSKQASFGDWHCFTSKDKNILQVPKADLLNALGGKKFDVVINVSNKNALFNTQIASQLDAAYKCGNQNLFGELDLIVERNSMPLHSYLKEVLKYLQMIRTEE